VRRRQARRLRPLWTRGLNGQGGFGGGPFAGGVDLGDIFGDLFGEMFNVGGSQQRGPRQQRGDDLRFDLTIDFNGAFFGTETEVKIRRLETAARAAARAPLPAAGPACAANARDAASFAISRDSSRWRALAQPAAAPAR
jgi:DnaJ-class molecular chaperone